MICPYCVTAVTQINQNTYEYDESGNQTYHQHVLKEEKTRAECAKEECGAWRNGMCCFKSDEW